MPIEEIVIKHHWESLRGRKNPCLKSTPQERLAAMAVICKSRDYGKPESRLSRLH
jgi:hypothetical protein